MMRFYLNRPDCNSFELDMISNAKIEGLLMPKSIEVTKNDQFLIFYEEPIGMNKINELINENYFDPTRFHDFLSNVIQLKNRLETYMLDYKNLNFDKDNIWYDPVKNAYLFIYLPDTKNDFLQELHLYRHIFIESSQIIKNNLALLPELRLNCFDLDRFCSYFQKSNTKIKSRGVWKNFFVSKDRTHDALDSKTIQKTRKSCLLDARNPTTFYEIHFNHITIGRSDECNIQINDPSISRRHAIIYKNKIDFMLEDLDSSNGTFHNGKVLIESVLLVNGDKLQFGDKEFIFIL